jgi:hypothetical protein
LDLNLFQASPEDVAELYRKRSQSKVTSAKSETPLREPVKAKVDLPRHRKGQAFIKGPIPFEWMRIASRCGGRGTDVGLLLWYAAGWQRKNPVKLTASISKQLGVHPKTVKRVLVKMEQCGLIEAEFHRGRSPLVTLLRPEAAIDSE